MFILPPPPLLYNPGALRLRVPEFDKKVSWKKCEVVGGKLSNLSRYTTCFRSFVNILQTYPVAIVYFCLTYLCFTPLFRGWRWFCQVTLKNPWHTHHNTQPIHLEKKCIPLPNLYMSVSDKVCVFIPPYTSLFLRIDSSGWITSLHVVQRTVNFLMKFCTENTSVGVTLSPLYRVWACERPSGEKKTKILGESDRRGIYTTRQYYTRRKTTHRICSDLW